MMRDLSSSPPPLLADRAVLALTGSPAVLTMPQTILMMRRSLVGEVSVMMTRSATRFLPPYTVRLHAGSWVYTDTHDATDAAPIPHLSLVEDVDLMLVMPATANMVARLAHGLCEDLVSTAALACPAPVVLVPSMNEAMWTSLPVRYNVALAREHGYHVIEPSIGTQLSDLRAAAGVMPPLEHFLDQLLEIVRPFRNRNHEECLARPASVVLGVNEQ